jgi:AcrR family transcriptional regulator
MSPRPRLTDGAIAEHAHELVEATFRVAAATGNARPPVRAILQESGLSRQIFYRCFTSSDDLMTAVLADGQRLLAEYLAARMAKEQAPEAKVRAWVTGVMRQAQSATERTRPFIIMAPTISFPDKYLGKTERVFTAMLTEAIADGVVDGTWSSPDPAVDALIIHDFVFDSMRRHLFRDERPKRETIRRLGDFAMAGLGNFSKEGFVRTSRT